MSRRILYVLFCASGAAGLVYQVAWTRLLTLTFGSTVFAVSAVLTAFMTGLCAGSWFLSRVADLSRRPLRLYAWIELGVGAYAAGFPLFLRGIDATFVGAHRVFGFGFAGLTVIKFFLAVALLLVPTLLMGGTLPLLARHVSGSRAGATRTVAFLYALNTAGAMMGTFWSGFFLIPGFGLRTTLWVAVAINLLVGAVALLLARREPPADRAATVVEAEVQSRPDGGTSSSELRLVLLVMFMSGLLSLAYEVVWTRVLVLYLGPTNYTFSTMLTAFLLGIAGGSACVGGLAPRIQRPILWLALAELGIGLWAFAAPPLIHQVADVLASAGVKGLPWAPYNFFRFGLCLLVLLPPTMLMGATFPLAAQAVLRTINRVGRSVGEVYSINTVGAILGSLLGGMVLVPLVGPGNSLVVLSAANLLLAAVALTFGVSGAAKRWLWLAVAAVPLLFLVRVSLDRELRQGILDRIATQGTLLTEHDGLETHLAINEDSYGHRQLWIGGDVVARSTGSVSGHNMLGHLPMLLAKDRTDALIIALGTGITAGTVSLYRPEREDVVEISRTVLDNVHYFEEDNYHLRENPKVRFVIDDGRSFVRVTDRKYDVIGAEPLHPWKAGVANLYTQEYYEQCRRLIKPGGIVVQWIPLYGLSDQDAKDLTRTFQEVFPETSYWLFGFDAVLLGHSETFGIDLHQLSTRMEDPEVATDLRKVNVNGPLDLLNHLVMGPDETRAYAATGRVMSDWFPFIEYDGPEHVYSGATNSAILSSLVKFRCEPEKYVRSWGVANTDSLRAGTEIGTQAWKLAHRGLILQNDQRVAAARDLFAQAVNLAPWAGDINYYLSRVEYAMGDGLAKTRGDAALPQVFDLFVSGLRHAPESPSLLYSAAVVAERMGRRDEALSYWRRLSDTLPEHAARGKLARERVGVLTAAGARNPAPTVPDSRGGR